MKYTLIIHLFFYTVPIIARQAMLTKQVNNRSRVVGDKGNLHLTQLRRSSIFCHSAKSNTVLCPESNSRIKVLEIVFLRPLQYKNVDRPCEGDTGNDVSSDHFPNECKSKSLIPDYNLCWNSIGSCTLGSATPSPQIICGRWSNKFYLIYQCIPLPLRRNVTWKAFVPPKKSLIQQPVVKSVHLSCPKSMIVVVDKAVAAVADLMNEIKCPMQEAYTNQVGRACHCISTVCNECYAPVTATNYRCGGHSKTNDIAIIQYFCLPNLHRNPSIPRLNLCHTSAVEVDSVMEAFILTPNYPSRYGSQLNCSIDIVVKNRSVDVYLLDLDVLYGHSLKLTSESRTLHMYATDSIPRLLVKNHTHDIRLIFSSNMIAGGRGIKLYYTVHSPISATESDVREELSQFKDQRVAIDTIKLTDRPFKKRPFVNKSNWTLVLKSNRNTDLDHQELALVVGIGTVVCTLALLLIVVAVLIFCLRPLKKKDKNTSNRRLPRLLLNMSTDDESGNDYERVRFSVGGKEDYYEFPSAFTRSPQWTTCSRSLYRCTSCGRQISKPHYLTKAGISLPAPRLTSRKIPVD
ncbi:hypothetical protein ACOME3_008984 [Neoechinorhynchus agilis]